MSMKKLKQKVASALIIAMSAVSVLPAAAAVGSPSRSERVKLTFDGRGGKWDKAVASKSIASKSNAQVDAWSNPEDIGQIERTFIVDRSDGSEWVDDEGNSFITLKETRNFEHGGDWESLKYEADNWEFAWYSEDNVYITENTPLYDGAKLRAYWLNPDVPEPEVDSEHFNSEEVVVTGLNPGEQLRIKDAEVDPETDAQRMEDLDKALANRDGKPALQIHGDPDEIIKLDIDVDNYSSDSERSVVITLPVPEGFLDKNFDAEGENSYQVKVVHFKEDGGTEVLSVKVDDDRHYMTFVVRNGFSPFYLVKTKDKEPAAPTVKVFIENVDYGYVIASTYDENGEKYLPLEEEVELPSGKEIMIRTEGYYFPESDQEGTLKSVSLIPMNGDQEGTPELIEMEDGWASITADRDCRIRAEFEKKPWGTDNDDNDMFNVWLDPHWINKPAAAGEYKAEVHVEKYNAAEGYYEEFSGWTVREATEDELLTAGVDRQDIEHRYKAGMDALEYDAAANTVVNAESLELKTYRIPFVITYEGQEYVVSRDEDEDDPYPYEGRVGVGSNIDYMLPLVTFDGVYNSNGSVWYDSYKIAYDKDTTTWNDVDPAKNDLPDYEEPQMYNYKFVGWQDKKGTRYLPDSKLTSDDEYNSDFYAFALYQNDEGKKYEVKAKGIDTKNPDDDDDNNNNNNNGSNGSRGSGGGSRSSSSSRDYLMHGNWIADANGWKFRKDSGDYATNSWGFINNKWYFFDANGNMVTGWYPVNGQWYYLNPADGAEQGVMLTGWVRDASYNGWFYLNESGAMLTGWQQINGIWYYLNPISDGTRGIMAVNTTIDGYYVNADGAWVQ